MTAETSAPRRPPAATGAGPSLVLVAAVTTALSVAGVVVPLLLSGERFPAASADGATLKAYVGGHADAASAAAVLTLAASVPLAVLAAAAAARLGALGVRAAGPLIALAGGVLASAAQAASAAALWAMSRLGPDASVDLLEAVHGLALVSGGAAHVVALGLLVAGIAVPAAVFGFLPRPLWVLGLAVAVLCELTTVVLLATAAWNVLPVARFGALVWLVAAGALLPRHRPRRSPPGAGPTRGAGPR